MSERLSIAFLSHQASERAPTGAEHSLGLLAQALHERGHRVTVVAPGPWALAERLRSSGIDVHFIRSRPCWLTYWETRPWPVVLAKWARGTWQVRSTRRLSGFLRGLCPDVVHVNCLPHLVGAAAGSAAGRPVVWHLRELLPAGARRRWLARRVARHATAVVAVSEAVARWVREEGLGERLHVVPNGVRPPVGPIDRKRARERLGLETDGVWIGLIGQLIPHKGALAFVEAARRALGVRPDLRFLLAGPGPDAFRRRLVAAVSGDERIRLLDPRPSAEELIAACDVVALATLTPDPFPRAVLEAMAAGRPVAAFDSGGTGEMVQDGETGLLVPVGDVRRLAEAFVRLGRDPDLREALGRAAEARAGSEFSMERHVLGMETLFRRVARAGLGLAP